MCVCNGILTNTVIGGFGGPFDSMTNPELRGG